MVGVLLQGGPWTPGNIPKYVGSGESQPVLQDSGIPSVSLSEGAIVLLANIAELRAFNLGGTQAFLTGYYSAAIDAAPDGGGGTFIYDASDTTSPDNGGTIIIDAIGRRWYRTIVGLAISARWFGAVPDGVTDSTAALNNCAVYCYDSGYQFYVPAGVYVYDGPGISLLPYISRGDGNEVSVLLITANSWFYDIPGGDSTYTVRDLQFRNGKGALRFSGTGSSVQRQSIIEDCYFNGYSVCAIGENFADDPYWKINRCTFQGSSSLTSFGVALAGASDESLISNCAFLTNLIHVKIGTGPINIEENDFIRFVAGGNAPVLVDIWIVAGAFGINIFNGNKFGNENLSTGDIRFLVASQDVVTGDFCVDTYSTANVEAVTDQIVIDANVISGAGIPTRGMMVSYTSAMQNLLFGENNLSGSTHPYYVENVPELDTNATSNNNLISQTVSTAMDNYNRPPAISNQPGFARYLDPLDWLANDSGYVPFRNGQDGNATFVDMADGAGIDAYSGLMGSSATITAATDILGGDTAANVALGNANGYAYLNLTIENVVIGQPFILEFDVQLAETQPLSLARVLVVQGSGNIQYSRFVRLQNNWATVRLTGTIRDAASALTLRFGSTQYVVDTATEFVIGRIRMYYATDPVNYGMIQTYGNGAWNGPHLIMGSYHLWIYEGDLWINNGAPTSATDGTKIGGP